MCFVKIHAIVKGYHAYRVKPNVGSMCNVNIDVGNKFDTEAVKVEFMGDTIGHVPATPYKLNRGIYDVLTHHNFPVTW